MNRIDLEGQVAAVTGGAQGIGLAIARRLGESGAKVAVWDIDEALVKAAASGLTPPALAVVHGHHQTGGLRARRRRDRGGAGPRITILVNSAGVAGQNTTVDVYPVEEWRRVIDINLNGTFYANRAVAAA
jgi:2-dehydro-3-deoxy-L-rhamnonate dehydrogenase (NAD+)